MTQRITARIRIDLASRAPAYQQIAAEIRALLVAGCLRPGDRLPPVRQLAMDLTVHHNTVALAYRMLAQEGWLDLKRGRGAQVLLRSGPPANSAANEAFSRQLKRLVAGAVAEGVPGRKIVKELKKHAHDVALRISLRTPQRSET